MKHRTIEEVSRTIFSEQADVTFAESGWSQQTPATGMVPRDRLALRREEHPTGKIVALWPTTKNTPATRMDERKPVTIRFATAKSEHPHREKGNGGSTNMQYYGHEEAGSHASGGTSANKYGTKWQDSSQEDCHKLASHQPTRKKPCAQTARWEPHAITGRVIAP